MNPWSALRSTIALIRYFRRERFDVLHVHAPVAALIGRIAARIAGIPLIVYTAHGFYFHDKMPRWKRSLLVALERFGGLFMDLLFSQSAEDAEEAWQDLLGRSPGWGTRAKRGLAALDRLYPALRLREWLRGSWPGETDIPRRFIPLYGCESGCGRSE